MLKTFAYRLYPMAKVKEQKALNPSAKGVHNHVLHVVVADLDTVFQAFFRRVKVSETPGSPRFRGRNRFDSFGFTVDGNGFTVGGRRLKLWALDGWPCAGIARRAGTWYACFVCEVQATPLPATGRQIGVDVSIASHLVTRILDAGWGYLVQHRTSKAAEAGRVVCVVDARFTSKTCSQCGYVFEALSLADRWIDCGCGLSMDRDHNAAVSILKRAGGPLGRKRVTGLVAPRSRAT